MAAVARLKGGRASRVCRRSGSRPVTRCGAAPMPPATETVTPPVEPETPVELASELGLDYSLLRDLLAAGEWEKADDETRLKLIEMAGEGAEARGWVYFTEVQFIPVVDFQTVDNLWSAYSGGKFGYSVQRKMWIANKQQWTPFFRKMDWTFGENDTYRKWPNEFIYSLDAKQGHLPLTNALRGTQLFQAILEHPAFNKPKKDKKPDWMKQ